MLSKKEIEEFEEYDEPRFDVKIVQKDDEETIWGDKNEEYFSITLRQLANDIFDKLYGGYEIWIKDPQLSEKESPTISEKYIPYIMSLEADNMFEDGVPLTFRLLEGRFVIGLDNEEPFSENALKFFRKFKIKI